MPGRQRAERTDEITNFRIGGMDANPSAELLQHIDASPSIRGVHHEMHRSFRFEHAAQSTQSCIRVGEMMENPGAHDLVEIHPQVVYALDGKLTNLKIFQVVFSLELLGVE